MAVWYFVVYLIIEFNPSEWLSMEPICPDGHLYSYQITYDLPPYRPTVALASLASGLWFDLMESGIGQDIIICSYGETDHSYMGNKIIFVFAKFGK